MAVWVVWLAVGSALVAFVALVAVIYWPARCVEPPHRGDPWRDAMPTYEKARAALPEHIRQDFHPEWPWLDPATTPADRTHPVDAEIKQLRAGDHAIG